MVRIEEGTQAAASTEVFVTNAPAFGICRDREDKADVDTYVRKLREPRYNRDGSRKSLDDAVIDTDVLIWHLRGIRWLRAASINWIRLRCQR